MFSLRQQITFLLVGTLFLGSFALEGCNYTPTPSGKQEEKKVTTGSPARSKPETTLPSDAVAVINGAPITREEFDLVVSMFESMDPDRFRSMPAAEREKRLSKILDQMIVDRLITQEAQHQGLQVPEELVKREYEALKATFPSEKVFLDTLRKARTNPESWKKGMRQALLMRKLEVTMANRLDVQPEEIERFWNENKKFLQQDRVHVRQIVVRTEPEAKQVLAALERGASFEALVKEYTTEAFTKTKGGDLGWVSRNEASEEFNRAVFSLKPQSVSAPFKGKYGYSVVQVLDKKVAGETSLDDYREKIRGMIRQQRWQTQRQAWLQKLKAQATIVQ